MTWREGGELIMNMTALGTDGGSVMTGRKEGLLGQFLHVT